MGIDLGQGGILDSVTVTPVFPAGAGAAQMVIPDERFPDIKGTLRYAAGANLDAKTFGATAMGATAKGTIKGPNFVIGFKQVASFKFHTAFYAGIKDSDGCIEESSTGLNFRNFIDCAANEVLASPQAPFYLPRTVAPNGAPFSINMFDQPGGRLKLQRRNKKRDRLNFLVAFRSRCSFLAYFVVEKRDGTHLPIKGFTWNHNHEIDVAWSKGQPTIARNNGGAQFESVVDNLKAGEARFDLLANRALTTADTIVTRFNRAMFAAQQGNENGDYSIAVFDNYTSNFTPDMLQRIENTGS